MLRQKTKLAKDLIPGDRVWLKPHSVLSRQFNEPFNVFTVSRTVHYFNGRGTRVLIYTEEEGNRLRPLPRMGFKAFCNAAQKVALSNQLPTLGWGGASVNSWVRLGYGADRRLRDDDRVP